ncbi:putative dynactin subunit 2 [Leucoagaricus sp. SymC.cos]|nr:putative dynactin subunit 2 [Leucoagaricus sp. SymC.cos]
MSGNKYADLPDIDTAPDIYETDDVFPTAQPTKAESSDDEAALSRTAGKKVQPPTKEELDVSGLSLGEATKKFRKAERRHRSRTAYVYPSSPDSPSSPIDQSGTTRSIPLSQRLRLLNAELTALETELADPANPLLQKEREEDNVDPGELIKDLVVVRGRLDKIRKGHEGRARLIGTILEKGRHASESEDETESGSEGEDSKRWEASKMQSLIEIDERVGELEKLIGSSNAALDETSPLPPPLLPLITRLNSQLSLLTQPRHIDSISRRLKLLLSDLDRVSAVQQHRRHPSQQTGSLITPIPENLLPILSRLGPALPQIPHILTRLRTLSALHTSAAEFQATLEDLEKEHRKVHEVLGELNNAVDTVEKSLEENRSVIKNNVAGLEGRVESLLQRLEELGRERSQ